MFGSQETTTSDKKDTTIEGSEDTAHSAKESSKDAAHSAKESSKDAAHGMKETAEDAARSLKETADAALEKAKSLFTKQDPNDKLQEATEAVKEAMAGEGLASGFFLA